MSWTTLGAVLPGELTDTRLQLHWAAQLSSAPGTTLLPARPDYAHTNLGWDVARRVLVGREVGAESLRAALVFEGLELMVLRGERERATLRLAGRSIPQALSWLGETICGDSGALSLPEHELPAHPVGDGAPFSDAGVEERIELAAWFADASGAIREAVADQTAASPVRCWPHHFDVASLITLDTDKGAEEARSIGVGFSPGDGSYAQPYFYVSPWPYPEEQNLPALTSAHWHRDGWTGAVLTGDRLISAPADEQQETVREMLGSAIAACREILER